MENDDQELDDEPDPALSDGCPVWIEAVELRAQSDRDESWVPEDAAGHRPELLP